MNNVYKQIGGGDKGAPLPSSIEILISQHIFTIMPERGGVGRQVVNYKDVEVCMHAYSIYICNLFIPSTKYYV